MGNSGFIYDFFSHSRKGEVLFRQFINKFPYIKRVAVKIFNKDRDSNFHDSVKSGQWDKLKDCIERECRIVPGDMVLVHSGFAELSTLGVSPEKILDYLCELIGEEGTLIFPTYPDVEIMKKRDEAYIFDLKKTAPWTGYLPWLFLRKKGVVRSEFPHNTLAAYGKRAEAMMCGNASGQFYSQGENSSWDYGIKHNMKILYLGIRACTAFTIVHYVEDIMGNNWPIKDWYEEHKYIIKKGNEEREYITLERKKKWFNYFCAYSTESLLEKKEYLRKYNVDGIYVGIMDKVKDMTEFMLKEAQKGKLAYEIPKKYWNN